MRIRNFILILALISATVAQAQDLKFGISGYADAYYVNDDVKTNGEISVPASSDYSRQFTLINAKKNQFDLNIAQLSGTFTFKNDVRGKLTLQYGSLPQFAYALDNPTTLQEAYVGVRILDNLWLDAGYYLTHIGGESFLPKDNWLSTHSVVTYFEPIQHAGAKLTFSNEKLTAMLGIVNSRLSFAENNQNKSYCGQFVYNFSSDLSLSYAGIIGNEETNGYKNYFLNNICLNTVLATGLEAKAQFDIASKEDSKFDQGEYKNATYTGISAQIRYAFTEKIRSTLRAALFDDEDGVNSPGMKGTQFTAGIEFKPNANSYLRLEGDMINLDDKYKAFTDKDGKPANKRMSIALSMGIWVD